MGKMAVEHSHLTLWVQVAIEMECYWWREIYPVLQVVSICLLMYAQRLFELKTPEASFLENQLQLLSDGEVLPK